MVAINPHRRGKSSPLLNQLTFNFDIFNAYWADINENESVINPKRLAKWREDDAKSNS